MKGPADGNRTFLASAGKNWSCVATSHGTQGGHGESCVAEGIVGDKHGDVSKQGFGLLLWRKVMSSALNLWPHLVTHLMFFPLALTSGSC